MNDLFNLIKEMNIPPEKMEELVNTVQQNPFAAMAMIQQLGMSPELLQRLVATAMSNPTALFDLAKQFGVDDTTLQNVKGQISGLPGVPELK